MSLVAHCGGTTDGAFLHPFTLTDTATTWTECLPLLHRTLQGVVHALERARGLFPSPYLGWTRITAVTPSTKTCWPFATLRTSRSRVDGSATRMGALIDDGLVFAARGAPLLFMTIGAIGWPRLLPLSSDQAFASGTQTRTFVPFPGRLITLAWPPSRRALSIILSRPFPERHALLC